MDKNTFFGIYRVPVIVSKPKTFYILFILAVGNNSVMTQHKKNRFFLLQATLKSVVFVIEAVFLSADNRDPWQQL